MEKLINQKIISVFRKNSDCSSYNRAFYKKHISGEYKSEKSTNHVGNFNEARYHKVLQKTIQKKSHKNHGKNLPLILNKNQESYIAKNVQVKECGSYKAGLKEQTLSFEIAGKDGEGGGVVPEHLHRHFWGLRIHEGSIEGAELAISQGVSEYIIEKASKPYEGHHEPYEGYYEQAVAEESCCDTFHFTNGQTNPWDPEEFWEPPAYHVEDMDTNFPELVKK